MGSLSWLLCPLPRQSLITFVNKHLNKLNLEVTELETQVSCVLRPASCPAGALTLGWGDHEHIT